MSFQRVVNSLHIIFLSSGKTLLELGPYLILGILLSELLKRYKWKKLVSGINKIPLYVSIPAATILGILSPLCTYGTVPIVIRLLADGVSPAALITFLSVSSLMNPQLFIITWGGLGPEIAVARLATVFLFGILLGTVLNFIPSSYILRKEISPVTPPEKNCSQSRYSEKGIKGFLRDFRNNLQYVGFYFLMGITLGAAIEHIVPAQYIIALFKPGRFLSLFIASALSVPLYACGGGAIPLIRSLINQGMSKASALAFLFVGPATRITPLMALASAIRPVFLVCYVITLILYALLFGLIPFT
ncbi:MAG: permease [Spirochaetales bacterium]|nr:permease [Spirochaetales bacterium]